MDPKDRFHRQFQSSVAGLQEQIAELSTFAAVGGERQDAVEHILSSISRLSTDVADAADHLPAYDQRTYADVLKALREQLNEATAKFAPKSRFQFKKRTANTAAATGPDARRLNPTPATTTTPDSVVLEDTVSNLPTFNGTGTTTTTTTTTGGKNYNAEIARGPPGNGGIRKPSFSTARDITLSDQHRVHIMLPASASRATSAGTLTNLQRCVVDMSVPTTTTTTSPAVSNNDKEGAATPFASLTLKNITSSVIVAGHVDGPVHVTGVKDSVVVVVARQVRIHECEDVVFYLHCVSRPIIEDCKGVRFARAPGCYLTEKQRGETNLFDQVDDFKWLKASASPNWSLLPEEEAIPDSVWKKTLAGGAGLGVEDILRNMGVGKGS